MKNIREVTLQVIAFIVVSNIMFATFFVTAKYMALLLN
jgi:hypothetical protein